VEAGDRMAPRAAFGNGEFLDSSWKGDGLRQGWKAASRQFKGARYIYDQQANTRSTQA
jgi:hypothetical protein